MKRRDFISGLLGFLAAVPVLGFFFKKKDEDAITLEHLEWLRGKMDEVPWHTDADDISEVLYGNPDAPGPKGILYMAIKETRNLHKLAGSGILK